MNDKEIEAYALKKYPEQRKPNKKGTGDYDANFSKRKAFIEGFKLGYTEGVLANDHGW